MFQPTKCDPELGYRVNEYLSKKGVQTPMIANTSSEDERINRIEELMKETLTLIGLDLNDDSIAETPRRVAKMFVKELFWGLDPAKFPKCTTVENKMHYDEMVVEKCTVTSGCEHHLVYFGTAHNPKDLGCWVAYIPREKVLGLSKLSRIVDYFSHRPQIQERLTEQVYHALKYILGTEDVAVVMKAQHFCVLTRGVEDQNSYTITSKLGGRFLTHPSMRAEFLALTR